MFYKRFVVATQACRTLNVTDKDMRISIFDAILYPKKTVPLTIDEILQGVPF
jgi:hypothetical protein